MSHPAAAMDLGARRWTELGHGHHRWLLAVPVGSCEQHGPHLPLDTDTIIAVSLAESLARRRDDTLVAPAIGIGASGEHASFPGTLSIGTEALTDVLVELARSALPDPTGTATTDLTTADPFSAVLFVNGHGGNVDALERARSLLGSESRRVDVWHPRVHGGDPHAGHTETSLMLFLHPDRVEEGLAEVGSTARFSEIGSQLTSGRLADVSPNGVLGDPTGATAEVGAALFEGLLDDLLGTASRLQGT